ncbi:putative LOC107387177-like protein [Nothobranchius furzeri]|uniref:LOC107387177-like protein n=1 Tax=Nothobranchius furzeri TaxID=105023 RepID=A0A9D3BG01_NOTFU|nr:putative LOC107387177-like protein [Nothobranchius furzeri]
MVRDGLFPSIILQAVCDHQGSFMDTYVGWPGSVRDSRVLRHSPLYRQSAYPPPGNFILADGGYPCLQHPLPLITHYKRVVQGVGAQRFNGHHSRARCIIERAFGTMKTRFRAIFLKRWRCTTPLYLMSPQHAPFCTTPASVLVTLWHRRMNLRMMLQKMRERLVWRQSVVPFGRTNLLLRCLLWRKYHQTTITVNRQVIYAGISSFKQHLVLLSA